jgi:hypothetical protein
MKFSESHAMINQPGRELILMMMVTAILGVVDLPLPVRAAQPTGTKPQPAKERSTAWLLAGREGECAPLSLLEKKGAEFRGIKSPEQLAKKMRAAGLKVEIKEHSLGNPPATEVRVPERGLYVMFVRAELCTKMEGADDAKAPKR